jgi:hypothetical protein
MFILILYVLIDRYRFTLLYLYHYISRDLIAFFFSGSTADRTYAALPERDGAAHGHATNGHATSVGVLQEAEGRVVLLVTERAAA